MPETGLPYCQALDTMTNMAKCGQEGGHKVVHSDIFLEKPQEYHTGFTMFKLETRQAFSKKMQDVF